MLINGSVPSTTTVEGLSRSKGLHVYRRNHNGPYHPEQREPSPGPTTPSPAEVGTRPRETARSVCGSSTPLPGGASLRDQRRHWDGGSAWECKSTRPSAQRPRQLRLRWPRHVYERRGFARNADRVLARGRERTRQQRRLGVRCAWSVRMGRRAFASPPSPRLHCNRGRHRGLAGHRLQRDRGRRYEAASRWILLARTFE